MPQVRQKASSKSRLIQPPNRTNALICVPRTVAVPLLRRLAARIFFFLHHQSIHADHDEGAVGTMRKLDRLQYFWRGGRVRHTAEPADAGARDTNTSKPLGFTCQ